MMKPQQAESNNIQQIQDTAMNVVEAICSIISMPIETILRPFYGTRYYPVPVVFFSAVLMMLLPAFSAAAIGVASMIPFTHFATPPGIFDIASLAKLYFLLSLVHSIRLYRRMLDMSTEIHSGYEGPALPFFQLIPGGKSFWRVRIIFEPAFVFIAATILQNVFIFQPGLAAYLHFAAFALAMKNFIAWYRSWEFLRNILDSRNASPIIAKLVENQATEDELLTIHLASFPKDLSPEIRQSAASHIARAFSQEG